MNGTNYVNVTYAASVAVLIFFALLIILAIILAIKESCAYRKQEQEQEEDYDEFDFYDKKEVIDVYRELRDRHYERVGDYNKLLDQYQDTKRKCAYYESEYHRMSGELKEKDEKIRWLLDMRQNQEYAMERGTVENHFENSGNASNGEQSENRTDVGI